MYGVGVWRRFEETVARRRLGAPSVRQPGQSHVASGRVPQVCHRSTCVPVPTGAPCCCSCCCRRQSVRRRFHAAGCGTSRHDELGHTREPPATRTPRDVTRRTGCDVIARSRRVRTSTLVCDTNKVKGYVQLFSRHIATERHLSYGITFVTCHPTRVNALRLNLSQREPVLDLPTLTWDRKLS